MAYRAATQSNAEHRVIELVGTLRSAEAELQDLTGGQLDAVLGGKEGAYLLRGAQDQLRKSEMAQRKLATMLGQSVEEQRKLTEQLIEERARLVTAQAVAKVGSWEIDLSTMKMLWSEETYRICGLAPGAISPTQAGFLELVHPEDRAAVDSAFRASLTTRDPCAVGHRIVLSDGTLRHVEERWHTQVTVAAWRSARLEAARMLPSASTSKRST